MGIVHLHEHVHEDIEFFLTEEQVIAIVLGIWLAVFGLVLGSFIDCAVSRWAAGEKMFVGRSRCLSCGHTLGAVDLIPVFSFLARRGRCGYCGEKIPAECLFAELLGAAGFVCVGIRFGLTPGLGQWVIWWAVLLALSLTDAAKRIIPDQLLLALAVNRMVWFFVLREEFGAVWDVLKACVVPAALLALVLLAEKLMDRELMGGGDVKLLFALALYLTWARLLLALVAGCLAGLVLAALAGKKRGTAVPFGPFLAAGSLAAVCFGDPVLAWYFSLF